ncbi:dihydroneopterin aldolase [Paenibacillus ginsengarvi]|uniref:7,8-dihydroneopterin aldolase n=1 Tax=Paenibacillus ginsengarvi TaxID=400777 RepID=A0A3B0B1X9_9BACL|nr:dihydroneopterin aldolase [Paenibacillus ginsengarvi]RKN65786.1 dihydroneopterin aldolase [Paenibacillus ginsengarvi]
MDKLHLNRMQFYGYHGVFPEENKLGQRFYVDLVLSLDLSEAGRTDDLTKTVNYAEVYQLVKQIVEGRAYRLIEALAENIASDVLHQYTSVNDVTVRVVKPHPPFDIHYDGVVVELTRKRAMA